MHVPLMNAPAPKLVAVRAVPAPVDERVARLLGWEFRPGGHSGTPDTWVGFRDGKECAWYHDGPPPYSSEWRSCGDLIDWMKERGSSFDLNYGEDNGCWECSWVTGGRRFTGFADAPQRAVCEAALRGVEG